MIKTYSTQINSSPGLRTFLRMLRRSSSQKGVALITVLLLLTLMTVASLVMVTALSSQTLIGGYYRNFRGSFYAADSGLNIARTLFVNQLVAGVPSTFGTPPISNPTTLAASALSTLSTNYNSATSLNSGSAGASWNGSFQVPNSTASLTLATNPPQPQVTAWNTSTGNCTAANPCPVGYSYTYNYALTSLGSAQGSEQQTVTETGSITLAISGQAVVDNVSFAYFGAFIDNYPPCIGWLVPGTMTGPMFTNTQWEFAGGYYLFTDPVGQTAANVEYWPGDGCDSSPTSSYNGIAPIFEGGLQLNQPHVNMPTNTYNQLWAVMDGKGDGSEGAAPTTATMQTSLQTISGGAAPYSPAATSGVFFTNPGSGAACVTAAAPCVQGGGFYIQGDANITLTPSGSTAQIYTITQGSTTTTITVDPGSPASGTNPAVPATTVIQSGSTTVTLNGVPVNQTTGLPSTMLYVNGSVTSLTGPGEGMGAVQDNAMINITATADITTTGDVLYKTEPVTNTQNEIIPGSNPPCCNGTPVDTLIPGVQNMNQVLGLYTPNGNWNINTNQADGNIEVDGSVATFSQGPCGSVGGELNTGPGLNTVNQVGGMIQSCIYGAAINTENTYFDRRFTSRANFAPPWFPSTQIQQGGPAQTNTTPTVQRIQWVNKSAL